MNMNDYTPIPKLSEDLIRLLDQEIGLPLLPTTVDGIVALDEKRTRQLIFVAGQRSIVDTLVSQLNEEKRGRGEEAMASIYDDTDRGSSGHDWSGVVRMISGDGKVQHVRATDLGSKENNDDE